FPCHNAGVNVIKNEFHPAKNLTGDHSTIYGIKIKFKLFIFSKPVMIKHTRAIAAAVFPYFAQYIQGRVVLFRSFTLEDPDFRKVLRLLLKYHLEAGVISFIQGNAEGFITHK